MRASPEPEFAANPRGAACSQAGGEPFECPTMWLGEMLMRPIAMLFRNLISMDVEESLRAGRMSRQECRTAEPCLSRSSGHCTTIAYLTETLGHSLPGSATVPAVTPGGYRLAEQAGTRLISMSTRGGGGHSR